MTQKPEMLLWLSDARGQYIPRDFANSFADRTKHVSGVTAEDWQTLEYGPDEEWYWETWDKVCSNAVVTDENGVRYSIHQDGDCWLVPDGMEWSDETETFQWPKNYDLVETIDGQWMVLIDGIQWGEGPRDASGASSQTWQTKEEAREAIKNE